MRAFSRIPLQVFSTVCHHEQSWHRQVCTSTLGRCPSSVSSADQSVAHYSRCPEEWFWRGCLAWIRHVARHDSLSKFILQSTLEGGRRRGRQRKCRIDNIHVWTSLPIPELLTRASCRKDWKRISAESSLVFPRRPNRSRD